MWRGVPFLLVAAGAALLPSLAPAWIAPAPLVLIYMLAGAAASLELGWAGLPAFAIAAWFSAGAWSATAIMHVLALPFWAAVPLGAWAVTVIALLVTSPLLRLPREVFAMTTLAIAIIVPAVLAHQKVITVASTAIPAANGAEIPDVLIALSLLAGIFAISIEQSPLGLALRARVENGPICGGIGLNTHRLRLFTVAIAASTAATAGCLLAGLQGAVSPSSDGFATIATIFAIAIIAGRRMSGAVMPALVIAGTPLVFPALADYRVALAGAAILFCAVWRAMSPKRSGNTVLESFNLAQPSEVRAE